MTGLIKMIFGSRNDRESKKFWPLVRQINEAGAGLQKLSDDELRAKTAAWKEELSKIEDKDELAQKLNEILPEAFAVVKNACRRLLGQDITVRGLPQKWDMVPFDVPAPWRHRPAPGQDHRNGHRRRQNARRHAARLSQRAHRPRRPCRYGQRLSRRARQRNGWARFTSFSA